MPLIDAENFYREDPTGRVPEGAPVPLRANYLHFRGLVPSDPAGAASAPAASVFVNAGRWMAACPFECGEAQVVSSTDRRFFCTTCGCAQAGGRLVETAWPDDPAAIEAALEARPGVFRNWSPGETVADLHAENAERLP